MAFPAASVPDPRDAAQPPAFLSTHPGAADRIEQLQELMPEAWRPIAVTAERFGAPAKQALLGSGRGC